jgi:hypothetical protein
LQGAFLSRGAFSTPFSIFFLSAAVHAVLAQSELMGLS